DFAGPFGTKKNDFKHILVIVDTLSRFVWLQATKSTAAPEVIKTIRDRVIPLVGAPSVAIVDQQSSYMSKQFQDFCRTAGILLKPIPQGASDGNGISERCIRSVTNHVKRLVADRGWKKIPEVLPLVEFIMRNARREDIRLSPSEIALGFRPRGPWSSDLPDVPSGLTPLQL
ncbi:unnamed protein product, partial [Heterosigma akashiwo]